MSGDRVPHGFWLPGGLEYSVRRQVLPRSVFDRVKQAAGLEHFHWSHGWSLRWGGPEVTEGVFLAHKHVNGSVMARIEGRVARAARELAPRGYEVWATVAVTRYDDANILERATYKVDVFDPNGGLVRGASFEITIPHELTAAQRRALTAGRDVVIDLHRLTPGGEVHLVGLDKLDQMVELSRTVRPRREPVQPDTAPRRDPGARARDRP